MKQIHIYGGGTFSHVRNHMAIAMPAVGTTAKKLHKLCEEKFGNTMEIQTHLTWMADHTSKLVTNEDVKNHVLEVIKNPDTKIIFFCASMCDFHGTIGEIKSGKYAERLKSSEGTKTMILEPAEKVLSYIRKVRKDIHLVAFKTTCGASERDQYIAGLKLLKQNSCNLVLANDTETRNNIIITPEEAKYHVTKDREDVLYQLVDITEKRSHLTFTRSTVIDASLVPWNSDLVPSSLRTIVDYAIGQNAYKTFLESTVGHFAVKLGPKEFLTSRRKSDFNKLYNEGEGLVKIETDNDDTVLAYGAKPSVGGQSQRIVFSEHEGTNCIVHFHCPILHGSRVPVVSQREYECGSHECGQNTSRGLHEFEHGIKAVMLDNHGPNIVFNSDINPNFVIEFMENNFDLGSKTSGPVSSDLVLEHI